ncbi:MAG TPA: serine/threonine-protein kinase, partial [Pyrinomonadaceae bacterium]|nr:serine/threonine-protein kinase [Pyrinomonadaceae bacterium]
MTLASGTKLGRYEIRSKLGAGGMSEVYLAEDTELHRKVALKVLPADVVTNNDRMRRFKQEATAAAALNHPNIAHIYEIGEHDGTNFIAMEYVDGYTLRQLIHDRQTDLAKVLRWLQHVAEGLAKAHAGGIVHRDLKPDNVMIARDGYAKILDFGLAKLVEPQTPTSSGEKALSEVATAMMPQHSLPGTVMGTVGYMSPEQAQGRINEVDHRSDIFAFGCILFEAATGQKAFKGKDALDSLHNIVHAPTPQIKDLNPLAPDELQRIVRRCLAKDPEKRYQSIKEVAIELEELRQELKGRTELEYSVPPARSDSSAIGGDVKSAVDGHGRPMQRTPAAEGRHSSSSAEYIVSEIKRHKLGALMVIVVTAITLSVLSFGLYRFLSSKRAQNPKSMKMTRLTSNGRVGSASISPDGKYVAYSA